MARSDDSETDEATWRYGLDDVDEDGIRSDREPLEPGSPSAENVFFVLVGVCLTLALLAGLL